MTVKWQYDQDAEEPAYAVDWYDNNDTLIDFSTGYTFEVKLVSVVTGQTVLTKTTNITGAATAPNVAVAWAVGELDVAPDYYEVHLKAITGGRGRVFRRGNPEIIQIKATAPDVA